MQNTWCFARTLADVNRFVYNILFNSRFPRKRAVYDKDFHFTRSALL